MWNQIGQSIGMERQKLESLYLQELTSTRLMQEITGQHERW